MPKPAPAKDNDFLSSQVAVLLCSYHRLIGRPLLPPASDPLVLAQRLYEADFAVVSHGTEDDPLFNYANLYAQRQFEMDWQTFVQLPSRLSAEAANRDERARLMARVMELGYIDDYRGVRISASGRRFAIEAVVWNLHDAGGVYRGQAATFRV